MNDTNTSIDDHRIDEGATIAEYGVAVAFVAILAGAGLLIFGETIGDWFASLVDTLGI